MNYEQTSRDDVLPLELDVRVSCDACEDVEQPDGSWRAESLPAHAEVRHGLCPECAAWLYADASAETMH